MTESPRPPERLLCQLGVFLPVLALPALVGGALWSLVRRRGRVLSAPWPRRLVGLALADLLVLVMLAVVLQTFWFPAPRRTLGGPIQSRRIIGVRLEQSAPGPGARITVLYPQGPAARAGLRVGDVVLAVDGEAVDRSKPLPELLQQGAPGASRVLRVGRSGKRFAVSLVPVAPGSLAPERRGLFEAQAGSCTTEDLLPVSWVQVVPGVASIALLLLLGWWRRPLPAGRYVLFTLLPAGAMVLALAVIAAGCFGLGPTLGGSVVGMLVGEAALLAAAAAFLPGLRRQGTLQLASAETRLSASAGVGLGLGYLMAGGLRVAIVIAGLTLLLGLQQGGQEANQALQASLGSVRLGPAGVALLFVLGVVVGPAAEEVYFRGGLLPWLGSRMGPHAALWVTALIFGGLHAHYGISTALAVYYGYVLGWARLRTGSLLAPFLLHAVINLVGGAALLGG